MREISDRPEVWPFIIISVVLHSLVVLFLPSVVKAPVFREDVMEVFSVPELKTQENTKPYRIADIQKPAVEEKPKVAKFLGLYDSTSSADQVAIGRVNISNGKAGKKGREAKEKSRQSNRGDQPAKSVVKGDRLFAFNKSLFDENRNPNSERGNATMSTSGREEFYPDLVRGGHTYLNVLKYAGVEYFIRMRRMFEATFNPTPSIYDYYSMNLGKFRGVETVLGVTVSRSGDLKELFIFKSSGIGSYDEETLRTVRSSAPFSTVPDKFLSPDGVLRMVWAIGAYP